MVTNKNLAIIKPTKAEQLLIETIRQEIEQGKVVTYWKVGKHIKKHLLKNKDRANYGATLFPLLSENLKIDVTTLYRSVTFFEEYPKILDTCQELTWSHMRLLLAIPDIEQRKALEKQVKKEHLSVSELTALIHHPTTKELPKTKPILKVSRTAPYVYQTKQIQAKDMLDLGFNVFLDGKTLTAKGSTRLHLNSIPHYTYKAYVLEVLDGDTIWADIDLGLNTWTTQKLRFRGINSEGIETKGGRTAKDYVLKALKDCKFIAIKTSMRDKYTRYLVDIFYDKDEQDLLKLINNGKFLNQELLDTGLAVEYL
jgi:endonuclease YncB( thermonuclease family)